MEHFLDADNVYVLTNKPGRVYLDSGEDSQAFDNFWTTNGIYISRGLFSALLLFLLLTSFRRLWKARRCQKTQSRQALRVVSGGVSA
jgi:hypothetical protein